jgi:ubiquinone/menaquinone biosynthesis C-methylase UbiE
MFKSNLIHFLIFDVKCINKMVKKKYIHGTSESEQERLSKLNFLTNESFIHFLNCKSADKILELGSGLGILAAQISSNLRKGLVTGIELSIDQLEKCPPATENLAFIQGDAHQLPFSELSFDRVYCRYILEHLAQPMLALKEAFRVLKPGGEIYIQENSILLLEFYPDCPAFKNVWRKFALLQQKLGGDSMIGIKLHFMLLEAGFHDIELSLAPEIHWHGKPGFGPWIENLVKNIEGASQEMMMKKLSSKSEISRAIAELNKFKRNPSASTYFYWNRAKAVK